MKRLLKQMAAEWEKTVFFAVVALFAVIALLWTVFGESPDSGTAQRGALLDPSLLRDNAFAFLDEMPASVTEVNNPFLFVTRRPPAKRRPWEPPKEPKVVKPKDPPKPKPVPPKPDPPKPEPPKKPKQIRIVGYLGSMVTTSGKHVAHVVTRDPVGKTEQLAFAAIGESAGDVKVTGFNDEALEIVDPKGERRRIPFGEQIKVVFE